MRKRLSRSQSVCFVLLWVALCFIVLTLTGLNPAFAGVGLVFVILGLSGRKK